MSAPIIPLAQHLAAAKNPAAEDWAALMQAFCAEETADADKICALEDLAARAIDGGMLAACARYILSQAVPLPLDTGAIDVCGTGGDKSREGVKTFNISTAAAFVVAACGQSVIKHGNRAVSSQAGSSDVLAALGVRICADADAARNDLASFGLCFVAAPAFHPVLKHAAAARRAYGKPSFFNLLGPLCNPARVTRQVMGVYGRDYLAPVAAAAAALGKTDMLVLHSTDGLDEISLAAPTDAHRLHAGRIETITLAPEDAGLAPQPLDSLAGGNAAENAAIIRRLFENPQGAPADMIALNAGAALWVCGKAQDLRAGYTQAITALQAGTPAALLRQMEKREQAA